MELIVDGKNVLEPVNLEKNKNEIMQQRASVPSQVSLTHFKENVGFFKANVKGENMNDLVTELQKTFSDINTRETKMYDQLDTVFRTVESIHKGSIEGIIVGVKSAQEAISQAEYAIETITETLVILQNFKNQLEENTEHLNDIDVIWDATQQLDNDVKELEKSLLDKVKKISENVKSLMTLKSNLDKLKHIKDVDTMNKDLFDVRQKFEQEKKKATGRMDAISEEIQQLQQFKDVIEGVEHLKDVDNIYADLSDLQENVAENKKNQKKLISAIQTNVKELAAFRKELEKSEHLHDIDDIHTKVENLQKVIFEEKNRIAKDLSLIQTDIKGLAQYQQAMEQIVHLSDVDALWESNEHLKHSVDELDRTATSSGQKISVVEEHVQHNADEIINLKNELLKYEVLEKEVIQFKGKVKILCYALGGTIGVVVLQIILSVIGIL